MTLSDSAKPTTDLLLQDDLDTLYVDLANRREAMKQDPALAGQFDFPLLEYLGPMEDLSRFGRSYFKRVKKQLLDILCGSDAENAKERDDLVKAILSGREAVAAAMASLLVTALGVAPLLAAPLAVLIVKLIFQPALETICDELSKSVAADAVAG